MKTCVFRNLNKCKICLNLLIFLYMLADLDAIDKLKHEINNEEKQS